MNHHLINNFVPVIQNTTLHTGPEILLLCLLSSFHLDLDECAPDGMGSRCNRCTNMIGSFICECDTGFYLSEPANTCFGEATIVAEQPHWLKASQVLPHEMGLKYKVHGCCSS